MEFDATFIFAAISFILFVFVMNKIFYAPVLKIMKARQDFVEQNYTSANQTKEETKKQTEYRESELEKSRTLARNKIAEHSKALKEEQSKKLSDYKTELYSDIGKQRDELKQSALDAKETLKDTVVDIAKNISDKLFGSSVTTETINKSKIEE